MDVGPGPLQLGVEVLEAPGGDAAGLDETFHIPLLQPDHPAELVGRDHSLVDEPVEAAEGHTQVLGRLLGAHPMDLFVHRTPEIIFDRSSVTVAICALRCYLAVVTALPRGGGWRPGDAARRAGGTAAP